MKTCPQCGDVLAPGRFGACPLCFNIDWGDRGTAHLDGEPVDRAVRGKCGETDGWVEVIDWPLRVVNDELCRHTLRGHVTVDLSKEGGKPKGIMNAKGQWRGKPKTEPPPPPLPPPDPSRRG